MGTKVRIKNSLKCEMTMGDVWQDFNMEKEAKNLTVKTLHDYQESLNTFLRDNDFDLDTPVTELTDKAIFQWIKVLKSREMKPASVNHYLRNMRTIVNWCISKGLIEPFKVELIKAQEESLKFFTDKELELLLEKPKHHDNFREWRTWAIVCWVLATGNRASTICELKIGDVDFNYKEITLRHTKNKRLQIIPLSPALETSIKEYIRLWRANASEEYFIFPNIGEEKLTYNALRLSFAKYCEKRGVSKSNLHGLRHSFARNFVKNNGNMFALQKILGHSTLDMTRKYVVLFSEDIKENYDKYIPLDTMKRNNKRTQLVKRNNTK